MELEAVDRKQLDVMLAPLIIKVNTEEEEEELAADEVTERIDQLKERIRILNERQVKNGQQNVPGNHVQNNHGNLDENCAGGLVEDNQANNEN